MALAQHKPTTNSRVKPEDSSVVAQPRNHEIYDHRTEPLFSLDAFLSGSRWAVTYFRQRLGKGDPTKKLDINSDPAYQSYDKYEKLELLVQSAITPSFRDRESLMEVSGSATVYSFLQPNIDDYFITTSNLGRLALFRVNNVNRRTHERESVYIIEYQVEEEITSDHVLFKDIHRKVVSTYVFSKQRLIENKNPILLKKTYDTLSNMRNVFEQIATTYYRDFFNVQTYSLQIPGQAGRHIDPFVLEFFLSIVPLEVVPPMSSLKFISLNNDKIYEKPNIWNILLTRNLFELGTCFRRMAKISPRTLPSSYFSRSGNFASADFVVTPLHFEDPTAGSYSFAVASCQKEAPRLDLDFKETKNVQNKLYEDLEVIYDKLPELPGYLPVSFKETYIFTDGLYDQSPNSLLEIMVLDYLRNEPINLDQLSFVVSLYPTMPRLEQFYYGPILLLLLKESDRAAYA